MEMSMSPDASCCVIALNGESGEEVWRSDASAIDPFTQPVVADGMVYVGGSGSVAALNTLTGDLLWKAELGPFGSSIQSSPVVIDGQVVVIGPMGTEESGELFLSGFDEATGTELWRLPLGPPDMPISPVALGEAVFVAGNSELLALEPA
jgi:outer membrane protein assembly factor BamB